MVYQAIPGFEGHLRRELGPLGALPLFPAGGLYLAGDSGEAPVFWHKNCWLDSFRLEFDSINDAARALKDMQRNWAPCLYTQFRRGSLIASKLPPIKKEGRPFPWLLPQVPVGAFTLLDAHTLLASPRCTSPFPGGDLCFEEDHSGPPSRAYLKLWEALVRLRRWPQPGERCLDAGASPGGWTWALARLGAQVTAVDRSPLDSRAAALPGVQFIRHDAFTLKPQDLGPLDWLFCDVICYPPRLYRWIEDWLASGLCKNFVCTIKMQGARSGARNIERVPSEEGMDTENLNAVDFETPRRFAALPGGQVLHLCHNKHELTWMKISGDA